jgi:hypothetical protein
MRTYARVALVSMAVSASFVLAGCGAIGDLKDVISRWFDAEKFGREVFPDDLPSATPMAPPENQVSTASKKKDKSARKLQQLQTVKLQKKPPITDSTEAVRPEGPEGQSTPSQPPPYRLRTPYPEAPPPGYFSR